MIKAAVVTVSDKGAKGEREDKTGPYIMELLTENNINTSYYKIIPDEMDLIEKELIYLCDELKLELVLTNGGTGFSPRDVTPEATLKVIEKQVPGFSEVMRISSLKITERAMLSRAISGIRGETLIINLPGSPKAAYENLQAIINVIPHGIDILRKKTGECAR